MMKTVVTRSLTLAVFAAAMLLPEVALACPVCGQAKEETRIAFIATTGFLTALPLAVIGGLLYWLWRRAKRIAEEEEQAHDGVGTPPASAQPPA